jgi:hypothetical protein
MSGVKWRLAVITLALGGALLPLPKWAVERYYSNLVYPAWQRTLTAASNLIPFALFDILLLAVAGWFLVAVVHGVRRARTDGRRTSAAVTLAVRVATVSAGLYLIFLFGWGLNYRRLSLTDKLPYDAAAVSRAGALELALSAVRQVNDLYERSRGELEGVIEADLADAFVRAQRAVGTRTPARPARPKWTIIDPYFEAAGVDGMTDPYFLETLVPDDLLPFERPFVVAHEWSHLAGFADEGEANFVGWLTCTRGSELARYSGWLFLYTQVFASLGKSDRTDAASRLAPGPRADLRAMSERIQREVKPVVANAGWLMYDRYLKANRIEAGTASYAEVVRLVLGIRIDPT